MRPLTTKQIECLSEINCKASCIQIDGFENQRDVGKLRSWNRFDPSIIEKVENKFAEIAMIGEEINNLISILRYNK